MYFRFLREIGQIMRMEIFEILHKGTFLIYAGKKLCFVIEVSSDVIFLEILYQVKFWHEYNLVLFWKSLSVWQTSLEALNVSKTLIL